MTKLVDTAAFVTASCYLTFGLLPPFSSDEVYWTEIDRISIRKAWLFGYWNGTIGLIYIIMESVFITPSLLALPVLFSASHHEFHVCVETLTLFQVHYYTSVWLGYKVLGRHGVIIVSVLPPCRFVFRHRGFEETCSIHRHLLEFHFDRTAALKMVAVHSTEPYRRAKLRYMASRKTTSRPHIFNLLIVSISIAHNVEYMPLHV
jgi:hypothetical protein